MPMRPRGQAVAYRESAASARVIRGPRGTQKEIGAVMLIVLIIVLVLLFGGGGGYYYGRNSGWGSRHYGGGLLGLVVTIVLILWLTGNLAGSVR